MTIRICPDCTTAYEGRFSFDHVCRACDLPPALNHLGSYTLRETVAQGRGLWRQYRDEDGIERAYHVGAMSGTSDAHMVLGVDAAEEEAACLLAEAREEFSR